MTEKMAVVCNGDTPASIMPTLIFSHVRAVPGL